MADETQQDPDAERDDRRALAGENRRRMAQELGAMLLQALETTPSGLPVDEITEPIPAAEFVEALESLERAGWIFGEVAPARLTRVRGSQPTADDLTTLYDLQERYPSLLEEVAELSWSLLAGDDARIEPDLDRGSKRNAVQRFVITDTTRERFYLSKCGKVPRFAAVDWEVVVKTAERGHRRSPAFPYALVAMETINDSGRQHTHETLTFAIGVQGLEQLIDELGELKRNLEKENMISPHQEDEDVG